MEAPHEKESKLKGLFKRKNSFEERLKLTKCVFLIIDFIKKQAPVRFYIDFRYVCIMCIKLSCEC